jgi:hypothetical protein
VGAFDDYTLAGDPTVGPTGAVSWATHRPSGRPVAVTELTDAAVSDAAFIDRLRTTAAALASVADPHVVPVREVVEGSVVEGEGSRRVWVIEDWVDGRALAEVVAEGPLTAEQSVALACGILRGLVAVQERGIVHGDVSPATIVVGAGGVPRLIGFGFAGLPGLPGADPRTDASAVATVLRDLLAGAASATPAKSGGRKAPKKVDPKKVEKVVARATSAKIRRRPSSAADLLSDLEKAARSDFGRRWERNTSLAPRSVSPPTAPAEAKPADATPAVLSPMEETQELPAPGQSADPAAESAAAAPVETSPQLLDSAVANQPPPGGPADATAVLDSIESEEEPEPESIAPSPGDESSNRELVNGAPVVEADGPAPTPDVATEPLIPPAAPVSPKPVSSGRRKRDRRKSSPPPAPKPAPAPVRDPAPSRSAASTTWGDRAPEPPGPPAPAPDRWSRRDRRQPRRGLVRNLAGVILLLLGAGAATAVERIQSDDARAADGGGANQVSTTAGPTEAEVASSDIAGTWQMNLTVVESTGFFGTRTGNSVDKTYTITSDCSRTPCILTLAVSGQTGVFALHREGGDYILDESGPNDCVDLATGALQVPNGGVAKVQAELRPSGAARTPRGDWAATGLTGSIVTTFDTTNAGCVRGSGRQRSTVEGVRE